MCQVALDASALGARPTGVGRYAKDLLTAMDNMDGTASLCVISSRAGQDLFAGLRGIPVFAVAPQNRALRIAYQEAYLAHWAKKRGAKVFHGLHYQVPVTRSLKLVTTIHDLTFLDHPEWHEFEKVRYFSMAIKRAVARSEVVICPSNTTAERLRQLFPKVNDVRVVYHGVSARLVPEHGGDTTERTEICFVGTIEPRKNLDRLVRAFDIVAARHPEYRLKIIGKTGWKTEAFEQALKDMKHRGNVEVAGYLDEADLRKALRQARALVYPSLEEGFGLPVLEALATGLNVVTSDRSAMAEVADGFAFFVDPEEIESIADGIERAAQTTRPLDVIEAQISWARSFTWEKAAGSTLQIYRELLRR